MSNFRPHGSGHWYFRLKDERAAVDAAMFRRANQRLRFRPSEGDEVVAYGRMEIYERRGALQLIVERLEPVGAGRLQARLEELKARLTAEGLFEADRKRPLPPVPRRIGIVTSRDAAALQDMLRGLRRRDPTLAITLAPCRVQGPEAPPTIVRALSDLQRTDVEVILMGRGGGSLEDLWAFNDEAVVRAVAASSVPVVCGVGHETDFTLADFAADRRAATPTAAAELAVPRRADLDGAVRDRTSRLVAAKVRADRLRRERLEELAGRLVGPRRRLDARAQHVDEARRRLEVALRRRIAFDRDVASRLEVRLRRRDPSARLPEARARTLDLMRRLASSTTGRLARRREALEGSRRALLALGPLQSLGRGYAIAVHASHGGVVRRARDVEVGDPIRVRLGEGALVCTVDEVLAGSVDLQGSPREA